MRLSAMGPVMDGRLPRPEAAHDALHRYARSTWASIAEMVDPASGLPADTLADDGAVTVQTSITNIGAYLWSTLVACRLGIIARGEATSRVGRTLDTLGSLERDRESGQFWDWYDHATGEVLTVWPASGAGLDPACSSVDNAWLAAGLRVVAAAMPEVALRATSIAAGMDFGAYYRPAVNRVAIVLAPGRPACYDTVMSESRIAAYLGIAAGRIPPRVHFGTWRTLPSDHPQAGRPDGPVQTYLGCPVFEGAYRCGQMRIVPSWGGSMFEALMPALFVPEEVWAPRSFGVNHPITVAAHIRAGAEVDGYWGRSASSTPGAGYAEHGCASVAMNPDGHYAPAVVTPHASFLALRYAPAAALANLARLERTFAVYGPRGFRDAVNVRTGAVSGVHLALDQGMVMAAIGNALDADILRRAFAGGSFEHAVRPVLSLETFSATPDARGKTGREELAA
jgi:Putative glucoamylase/Protein of unknown function (DUF3131)